MNPATEFQDVGTKDVGGNELASVEKSSQDELLAKLDAMQTKIDNGGGVPMIKTAIEMVRAGKINLAINYIKNDSDKLHSCPPELIAMLEEVLGVEIWPKFSWQ